MDLGIRGKVALVTSAGRGIGAEKRWVFNGQLAAISSPILNFSSPVPHS